jgi:hypothetical protein
MDARKRFGIFQGRNRIADFYIFHPGQGNDVTGKYLIDLLAAEILETV